MRFFDWFDRAVSWAELIAILAVVSALLVAWEIARHRSDRRA